MNRRSRLFASLRVLGINPKMDTFAERKRVQKLVYLLDKVFGIGFNFSYNWYLHGPYSPEVTTLIFDVIERGQSIRSDPDVLSLRDSKKIDQLKAFLGDDLDSNDKLELLVSLHFLTQHLSDQNITQEDVVAFLKTKKPYFTDEEIFEAIDRLRALEGR
jgi:uncharacterized protein YwgA